MTRAPDRLTEARLGLPFFASSAAILLGIMALLGWQFDLPALRSIIPGHVAMNPATAVGFILAGVAIALMTRERENSKGSVVGGVLSILVVAIGAIKLIGLVTGRDWALDQILYHEKLAADIEGIPNRMAPNTAGTFLVVGLGLLAMKLERGRTGWWSQGFGIVAILSSFISILGYAFGVRAFYGLHPTLIPMALNTALAFFAISLGMISARPDRGLAAVVAARHAGGTAMRWFLPFAAFTIIFISWWVLRGETAGLYPSDFAACLTASSCIVVIAALAAVGARSTHRSELARQAAVEALRQAHDELEVKVLTRTAELTRANQELGKEIAEHQRARNEAHRERAFSSQIIESSVDGIAAFDCDYRITAWNPGMERISGLPREQVLGRRAQEAFPFLVATGELEHMQGAIVGEVVTVRDRPFEVPQTGRKGFFEGSFSPLRNERGEVIGGVAIVHEITQRKRLEDQFRQAQKLEAVGRLAGGVAHDFNNLLTAIMGHSQFLKMKLSPTDPGVHDVDEVLKASTRAAALTRQLLAFSRLQVLEPKILNLNSVISDLEKMLRRLIGEDVDLVTAGVSNLGMVKADRGQIEQVLMNLAVNARDAMPEGGQLTIETASIEVSEALAATHLSLTPGRYVMLAVSDSGTGMAPEVRARAFEPFFTTKEVGKGTGLGLSTVHGIVTQSGGDIEIYSEPGQGTTVKIYLPQVEESQATVEAETRTERLPGGRETILLVEDEVGVRRVVAHALQELGYTVVEAADASDAVAIAERRDQSLDLLATDVVMPIMNGPELASRIRDVRPDLRVLLISGYADRALIHQGLRDQNGAFLQKPFTPETLAAKVREVLDRAA